LAITSEPEMLESKSTGSKHSNYSLVTRNLSQKLALAIGAQGLMTSAKNA